MLIYNISTKMMKFTKPTDSVGSSNTVRLGAATSRAAAAAPALVQTATTNTTTTQSAGKELVNVNVVSIPSSNTSNIPAKITGRGRRRGDGADYNYHTAKKQVAPAGDAADFNIDNKAVVTTLTARDVLLGRGVSFFILSSHIRLCP
jgi:hypothetical protein